MCYYRSSMNEQFELKIIHQDKLIQVSGFLLEDSSHYQFLNKHRRPLPTSLSYLARKISYKGSELERCLIFTGVLVLAEIINMVVYSNDITFESYIICCLLETLIMCCAVRTSLQVVFQAVFAALSVIPVVLAKSKGIADVYGLGGITLSLFLVFLGRAFYYIQEKINHDTPNPNCVIESNLIIANYLLWKGGQVVLQRMGYYNFDYSSLIVSTVALVFINGLKIYDLFDYQILQVLQVFKKNFIEPEQQSQTSEEKDELEQGQKQQEKEEQPQNMTIRSRALTIEHEPVASDKSSQQGQTVTVTQEEKQGWQQYETDSRLPTAVIMLIMMLIGPIILMVAKLMGKSDDESLVSGMASSAGMTLLLIHLESVKFLIGQNRTKLRTLMSFFIYSVPLLSGVVVLVTSQILGLSSITATFVTITPALCVLFFTACNDSVHQDLRNTKYRSFFFYMYLPIVLRATLHPVQTAFGFNTVPLQLVFDIFVYLVAAIVIIYWFYHYSVLSLLRPLIEFGQNKTSVLFEVVKQTTFNYNLTANTMVYLHLGIVGSIYPHIDPMDTKFTVSYFIFFLSPLYFLLIALKKSYEYERQYPESYFPSICNVICLIIGIGYAVASNLGMLSQSHVQWSMILLVNLTLFFVIIEGQQLAVVSLHNYALFARTFVTTIFFLLVYLPFISIFISGYFLNAFDQKFFFYFSIVGFFYIWLVITIIGLIVHRVLNLSQKAKKELFIAHFIFNQMKRINMKEDIEKVLMMANAYESLNSEPKALLQYLNSKKHIVTQIRKEKQYEYDYEFIEPEDALNKKKLSIKAKSINPLKQRGLILKKTEQDEGKEQNHSNNPVLKFFEEKQKAKIDFTMDLKNNKNQIDVQRFAKTAQKVKLIDGNVDKTYAFRTMFNSSDQPIAEYSYRLFLFLSDPSPKIALKTFIPFMAILTRGKSSTDEAERIYQKFSFNALLTESNFKEFIVDYVEYKYEMKKRSLADLLRTFCCREVVPLMEAGFDTLEYYMMRKKVTMDEASTRVWVKNQMSSDAMEEFAYFQMKQHKLRANLLRKVQNQSLFGNNNFEDEQEEKLEVVPRRRNHQQRSKKQKEVPRLKDKDFMKPQAVNSLLVNALGECYIFYEQEKENFQVQSIQFNFSNILAVAIKVIDMVLIFGFPTVVVLIAYYKNSFSEAQFILGFLSYPLLLYMAAGLTLLYTLLLLFHKQDFAKGTLGLDGEMRSLTPSSFKFYTTKFIFLLGSGLANHVMAIALNATICSGDSTLYNFSATQCYDKFHYGLALLAVVILVVYWPMAALTYPFSNAIERDLEIKYTTEYEVVYLQVKFLINGYNILLNPYPFQTEQFIASLLRSVTLAFLAILFIKTEPSSYTLVNRIEGKVYLAISILSFTGTLCFFIGFTFSVITISSLLGIFIAFNIILSIKNRIGQQQIVDGGIVDENIKNQQMKIRVMRKQEKEQVQSHHTSNKGIRQQDAETSNVKLIGGEMISKNSSNLGESASSWSSKISRKST